MPPMGKRVSVECRLVRVSPSAHGACTRSFDARTVSARDTGHTHAVRRKPDRGSVGPLDLAFSEKNAWAVVDFKTDRELEKELEHYKRQVGLYALSIEQATGQPAAGY